MSIIYDDYTSGLPSINWGSPAGQAYLERMKKTLHWSSPELKQIDRLRLISDPGFPLWDVSYCHGIMQDGEPCDVILPFDQLPKKGTKGAIIKWAKRDNVYAKGLGVLDNISYFC